MSFGAQEGFGVSLMNVFSRCLAMSLVLIVSFGFSVVMAQPAVVKGPVGVSFNTPADEDNPHPVPFKATPGSYRLYYSRTKDSKEGAKVDLFVSTWSKARREWANEELVGPQVQTKGNESSCFVTPYGIYPQTIWFSSTKEPGNKKHDIFGAVRDLPPSAAGEHRVFSGVRALTTIDTANDENHPWLARDMKSLFFTKETKEGPRVAVALRQTLDGPRGFEEAAIIEDLAPGYFHPTLTPDSKTMFLQGPREGGSAAIYLTKKGPSGWSAPILLKSLNHPDGRWDGAPNLSRDGLTLFFSSDRPGGKGGRDIYSIPVASIKD
ncbi:MAG: hypothetical protein ACKO26_04150 [Planctomycetota bacterium]